MSGPEHEEEDAPAAAAGVQEQPPADADGSDPSTAGGTGTGDGDGVVEFDERRSKMERLRAEGVDPYPAVTLWNTRTRIADVLAAHDPARLDQGAHPDLRYTVAGRLISRRGHGKTAFLDLRDLS